jgi:hypothetical protein
MRIIGRALEPLFDGTMIWNLNVSCLTWLFRGSKKSRDCGQGSAIARTYYQGWVQAYESDLTVMQGEQLLNDLFLILKN